LLGYIGYAYVRNVVWLTIIGSVLVGISSITFAQLFAYAREAITRQGIPQSEAPLYMNIFRLLFSLAWTIGPAISAWVMIHTSYRGIFLVCAAFFAQRAAAWASSWPGSMQPSLPWPRMS
ncbi:MAG: hypothetical protein ABUL61_02225, partial [Oleiharenicola lentus]